ncbi:hypothetical protein [Comamonas terrae]|uniref:Lipoprotein n=1 Tax=Comamonas terrae TaxID=673548 RepID=A0ABW5URY2_9BURK|nr:hypothetical protein [Comamonas terrae]
MKAVLLIALLALAGCQSAPVRVELQRVNVPIPVACAEPIPVRPVMPTDQLEPGVALDQFVRAAQAEIERREGYETQLRAALENCRRSVEEPI